MISTQSTSIYNYNQIYDYLRTIKFNDYISNKRDIIHQTLYENALNSFIKNVNDYIIGKNVYMPTDIISIANQLLDICITNNLDINNILNKDQFKFIEYKDKVWYKASKITLIYTGGLVKTIIKDKNNKFHEKYIKLVLGPISLEYYWKSEYILKENINNILLLKNANYTIKSVDYINGTVDLIDKNDFKVITINLDYIDNLNDHTFYENYPEMFRIKRNKPMI